MNDKNKMLDNLGMYWEGKLDFQIPCAGSAKSALHVFNKNISAITWNCMSTLERNPTTLPQTETILKGQSVTGISIDDLMQVKRYGDGAKKLVSMIAEGSFKLDEKTACTLHNYVGKEEALTWGKFRNSLVTIQDVNQYTPPESNLLSGIAAKGFTFLQQEVASPQERAVATFLFMARTQFFHDANKRTASLMMNGTLMQEGIYPITIMNRNSEEFHTKLSDFYNTGNATKMMQFFERSAKEIYKGQDKEQTGSLERREPEKQPEKKELKVRQKGKPR